MTPATVVEKLRTSIPGFDLIANGGLPKGRTTLVSGTAGSGKTVMAVQFLAAGILENDEPGVFVTFEESPDDIRENLRSLNWDISLWEQEHKWQFVDASPEIGEDLVVVGQYDLAALLARIENAVRQVGAKRVSMDSLGAIFSRFHEKRLVRYELFRIVSALKKWA
ncbi:circadian clock protein KaiC [Candidatus Moduliflexus flocculans]|uniref:Circadian clock protein KaiC n=1 Tax=Candidatus Moduliflexus flocculans TaxID=1499966 RepID=A0A0S6W5U3_9BACT|nr:circadian clock protein KaiC [Candidatus Moduliflexus flocculans]